MLTLFMENSILVNIFIHWKIYGNYDIEHCKVSTSRTFEIFYQTKVNTSVENENKRAITQDPGYCN